MNELDDTIRGALKSQAQDGTIDPCPARRLARLLGRPESFVEGDALPPLWHWLYLRGDPSGTEQGPDGHARRGGLIPPIDLPQRLWASGTVWFHAAVELGSAAVRRSEVTSVEHKEGRHGPLCFVTLRHELSTRLGGRVIEEQTLVYRDMGAPAQPTEPPVEAPSWYRVEAVEATHLTEYSALTQNRHRIHIDRHYATLVEGYRGLVVHGPLLATWLAELAGQHLDRPLSSFAFRAIAPAFEGETIRLAGRPTGEGAELWASSGRGVHMVATARTV